MQKSFTLEGASDELYGGAVGRINRRLTHDVDMGVGVPGLRRQLQDGQGFKLTGSSGPGIEKVAAPPVRSNEHIRGPAPPLKKLASFRPGWSAP